VGVREGGALAGIISERGIVHGLAEHAARCPDLTVADLMARRVVARAPGDRISRITRSMTENRIRRLPVVEGARLSGVISRSPGADGSCRPTGR
jgi:CBS domain-containing protein